MNPLKLIPFLTASVLCSTINLPAQNQKYHIAEVKEKILAGLLAGEFDTQHKAVKWKPTRGDLHEFNALEEGSLYTFIDTTFEVKGEGNTAVYVLFHTAPMITNEDGEFINSNSCHVCGVNIGYLSLIKEEDSLYINRYIRSFAKHGTFGEKNYTLSFVDAGDGYEFIKVDDPYSGMGVESVATKFYMDGELLLSFISKENNNGNRTKNQKGYYEFKTSYKYDKVNHTIKITQTGFKIDEKTGKKIITNQSKTLNVDGYTMHF